MYYTTASVFLPAFKPMSHIAGGGNWETLCVCGWVLNRCRPGSTYTLTYAFSVAKEKQSHVPLLVFRCVCIPVSCPLLCSACISATFVLNQQMQSWWKLISNPELWFKKKKKLSIFNVFSMLQMCTLCWAMSVGHTHERKTWFYNISIDLPVWNVLKHISRAS